MSTENKDKKQPEAPWNKARGPFTRPEVMPLGEDDGIAVGGVIRPHNDSLNVQLAREIIARNGDSSVLVSACCGDEMEEFLVWPIDHPRLAKSLQIQALKRFGATYIGRDPLKPGCVAGFVLPN